MLLATSQHSVQPRLRRGDLLSRHQLCAHCGKCYLGASAKGNGGRYRYYVCFSRQRYGKKAREGDRLHAEALEEAILEQLLAVLEREPMVREAISEAFAELDAEQPQRAARVGRGSTLGCAAAGKPGRRSWRQRSLPSANR